MKFSFAALTLLASVVYAQTIASEVAQIPSCALSCLTTAVSESGCGLGDYSCQCGAVKDDINSAVTPCVQEKCAMSDSKKVQSVLANICTIQTASGGGGGLPKQELKRVPVPAPAPILARGSFVSGIGAPTYTATSTSAAATTTTTPPAVSTSAPASSSPTVVLSSPGNKLQAGGLAIGAALLAMMV